MKKYLKLTSASGHEYRFQRHLHGKPCEGVAAVYVFFGVTSAERKTAAVLYPEYPNKYDDRDDTGLPISIGCCVDLNRELGDLASNSETSAHWRDLGEPHVFVHICRNSDEAADVCADLEEEHAHLGRTI